MPPSHRNGLRRLARALLWVGAAVIPLPALAQTAEPVYPTLSAYGGAGLLDTRTARFMPDGYLAASISVVQPDDRIALTFQALPWLETTFRYSINHAVKLGGYSGNYYDRSFDVKFRLLQESADLPQIALGLQDIVGTGIYSGEYLVGSKRWGAFDVSLGLGWGRLASRGTFRNPLGLISHRFDVRPGIGTAGAPQFTSFFRGSDMGIFGGIEYTTPIPHLKIQLEYSSDAYRLETQNSGHNYGFPVNAGVSYRPWAWLDVGLSLMHGRDIGLRLSAVVDPSVDGWDFRLNPSPRFHARDDEVTKALENRSGPADGDVETRFVDLTRHHTASATTAPPTPSSPPISAPPPAPASPNEADATAGNAAEREAALLAAIDQAVAGQALQPMGIVRRKDLIAIAIENDRYLRDAEAMARTLRVLSQQAPDDVDTFQVTTMRDGQPLTTAIVPRDQIDHLARHEGSPAELWHTARFAPARTLSYLTPGVYPRFGTNIFPFFQQSVFDPRNPFYFELGVGASATVELARGWSAGGTVSGILFDNLPGVPRQSDSVLPHVRTDTPQYLDQGRYGLDALMTEYHFKLAPELFGRVEAGYLEAMFAGAGGELLYRPFGQRWAIGADLWGVQQRGFDEQLDLRHYRTMTGHLSLYYEMPWHDIRLTVSAGRYLAGDYGATFEASRSFATGVRIGAWFTLTNVSAQRFGEGSFDKGIRIIIPLEWAAPIASQSVVDFDLRPVQRDGGQMLYGGRTLYDMTRSSSYGALMRQWNAVLKP